MDLNVVHTTNWILFCAGFRFRFLFCRSFGSLSVYTNRIRIIGLDLNYFFFSMFGCALLYYEYIHRQMINSSCLIGVSIFFLRPRCSFLFRLSIFCFFF